MMVLNENTEFIDEKTLKIFENLKKMVQNFLIEKFKINLKKFMRQILQFLMLRNLIMIKKVNFI